MNVTLFNRIIIQKKMKLEKASVLAARDVLVGGLKVSAAASRNGCSRSLVTMTVNKIKLTDVEFTEIEIALMHNDMETATQILKKLQDD